MGSDIQRMENNSPDTGIYLLLGEIKGQLSSLLAAFAARNAEDDKKHETHERRLTALERFQWIAIGLALASGGSAGAIAGAFLK